jgi:hypothetical protein
MNAEEVIGAMKERGSGEGDVDEPKRTAIRGTIRRLKAGAADMGQAARGAALLAASSTDDRGGRMDRGARTALAGGVVLAYARPFTTGDGNGALKAGAWTPSDPAQARLHKRLIRSRNERYRPSAPADPRGSSSAAAGWFAPVNTARSWLRVSELAELQGERMQELAGALENELDATTSTARGPRRGGRVRA